MAQRSSGWRAVISPDGLIELSTLVSALDKVKKWLQRVPTLAMLGKAYRYIGSVPAANTAPVGVSVEAMGAL